MTVISFASAILTSLAVAVGTVAQEPTKRDNPPPTRGGESQQLTLKLRENQSTTFRVTAEKATDAGSTSTSPADFRLTYQLTPLRTSPSGERALSAMIDVSDDRTPADPARPVGDKPAEKPGDKTGDKADDKTDKANDTSVDKGQRAEEILGRDRAARKVLTLKLDAQGNISGVEGLEDLRAAIKSGESPIDASVIDHVSTQLALIVGSGLHGMPLEIGKQYSPVGVVKHGSSPSAGDASKGGAAPIDKSLCESLCAAKLRFDGVSGNTARFSIVDARAADRTLGQATYDTNDGLIESLTAVVSDSSAPAGGTPPARGMRVTIHRVGDNVTEPPR